MFPKGTMLEINSFNPSLLYLHVALSEMPFALNVLIFSCFNLKNYFPLFLLRFWKSKYYQNTSLILTYFLLKLSNVVNRWFSLGELWASWGKELDNIHLPVSIAKQNVLHIFSSVQFSHSVPSNSLRLRGLQHARPACPSQLLEFTQTHVHWVGDAIQPPYPLSSPSPPTFNLSQHQGLFKWVNSLHQVAKVLEFQLQHQSFHWIFKTDFLQDWLAGSLCSPRNSQESSPTPQFKSINSLVLSFLYSPTLISLHDYWKNHSLD